MFFDKTDDQDTKTVDETLYNDEFEKLNVELVDIDLELAGGDKFEIHYHGPEDKKPLVSKEDDLIKVKEPKVERKNGKTWKNKFVNISIVTENDVGKLVVTVPANNELVEVNDHLTSGDAKVKNIQLHNLNHDSVSGDLKLENTKLKTVNLKAVSGDIKLKRTLLEQGNVNLASGDFKMENSQILDSLTVMTMSGDNKVENVEVDQCDLETASGDNSIFGGRADHAQLGKELNGSRLILSTLSGDNIVR